MTITLIKSLMGLSDPGLTRLFLRECKQGSFVAEGLANIGRPALDSILKEVGGKYSTCAVISLGKMAQLKLTSKSNLSANKKMLEADFRDLVIPRLQDEVTSIVAQGKSGRSAIIRKHLADIKGIID